MKAAERDRLLGVLEARFAHRRERHPGVVWAAVRARLEARPDALQALQAMEATGGEPDVVELPAEDDGLSLAFCDCSPESPAGRRSLCFDDEALHARKADRPAGSAVATATTMGIALMTEAQYRVLQAVGEFDLKTSSWVATPAEVRQRGGALFCDRRYGRVFVYHNGAPSYYAARGFRGVLRL